MFSKCRTSISAGGILTSTGTMCALSTMRYTTTSAVEYATVTNLEDGDTLRLVTRLGLKSKKRAWWTTSRSWLEEAMSAGGVCVTQHRTEHTHCVETWTATCGLLLSLSLSFFLSAVQSQAVNGSPSQELSPLCEAQHGALCLALCQGTEAQICKIEGFLLHVRVLFVARLSP